MDACRGTIPLGPPGGSRERVGTTGHGAAGVARDARRKRAPTESSSVRVATRAKGTVLHDELFMRWAMDAYGGQVYLVALSHLRSVQDAEDVAQDVFLRLLSAPVAFEDDDHLKAWLLRVTVNRCRELRRSWWDRHVSPAGDEDLDRVSASARRVADLSTGLAGTESLAIARLERNPVWDALQQLPDDLRMTATLYYVLEVPGPEVARIMGCSPVTVRTRLKRACGQMGVFLKTQEAKGQANRGRAQEGGHDGLKA